MIVVDPVSASAQCPPIVSSYSNDCDMIDLVEIFVSEVPDKVQRIVELEQSQRWVDLKRAVHQLKGSAGGYGFDTLTPTCMELEYLLGENPGSWEVETKIQRLVNQLLQLRSHD